MSCRRISFVCLVALAGGCASTIESRIRQDPAAFHASAPAAQQTILAGQINRGLTREQVRLAWGDPSRVDQYRRGGRDIERWIYERPEREPPFQVGLGFGSGWHDDWDDEFGPTDVPYRGEDVEVARVTFVNGTVDAFAQR